MLIELILGLQCIHQNGLIHKNLTVENIFVDDKGNLKISDYGISSLFEGSREYEEYIVWNYVYVSPEVLATSKFEKNSDIWSLGCIAHEFCTFKPPYVGCDKSGQLDIINKEKYSKFRYSKLPSEYTDEFKKIIASMFIYDKKLRPTCENLLGNKNVILYLSKKLAGMSI